MPAVCPWNDEVVAALKENCMEVFRKKEALPADTLLIRLMEVPGVPMHYPYHHFITPIALLTLAALEEDRKAEELAQWLDGAEERARTVPGGFCGNCGACGAAIGAGIFVSVYTGASPMSVENWQWANQATGLCLQTIAAYPGPRCCKRVTFLAAQAAVPYLNQVTGLHFRLNDSITCTFHRKNATCLEEKCPFYPAEQEVRP